MGKKKDKLIRDFLKTPITVGEECLCRENLLTEFQDKADRMAYVKVKEIDEPNKRYFVVRVDNSRYSYQQGWVEENDIKRIVYNIGANPFPENSWRKKTQHLNYDLSCILTTLGFDVYNFCWNEERLTNFPIPELSFNPYVIDKDGNKRYYQRDFCWSVKDEQRLITSIYNGLNCGSILVRRHSYEWVEQKVKENDIEDVAFNDIVDGKQRLNAIIRFITDQFKDEYGNYFSDLSKEAQREFLNTQAISYAAMGEKSTDQDVIDAFLTVNHTGRVVSAAHIHDVQTIKQDLQ